MPLHQAGNKEYGENPAGELVEKKAARRSEVEIVAVIDNFLVTVPLFNSLSLPFTVLCAIAKGADAMAKR